MLPLDPYIQYRYMRNDETMDMREWLWYSFLSLIKTITYAKSVDPDETARMSRLIWIYTVCLLSFSF